MADQRNGGIAWADETWNALRGCSKVSAGCANCYAESMAARFSDPGQWGHGIATREGGRHRWTGAVVLDEKALLKPLRWKKPRRIFVTSIGDPFHESVTDEMLDRLFAVMALTPQHTYQLLTKREGRMQTYINDPATTDRIATAITRLAETDHRAGDPAEQLGWHYDDGEQVIGGRGRTPAGWDEGVVSWPLSNLWLGVSVENQAAADERIPHLLATPAAVRFISAEPLLGPVDLTIDGLSCWQCPHCSDGQETEWDTGANACRRCEGTGKSDEVGIDWVIVGGESGPKARPMHPAWARSLRDQCKAAGVAFLFKQHGEWAPTKPDEYDTPHQGWVSPDLPHGRLPGPHDSRGCWGPATLEAHGCVHVARVGKRVAGRLLDGVEHNEFPDAARAVWKTSDLPTAKE